MQNSDLYTEFLYQAEFQRYRGLYLCKIILYVQIKQGRNLPLKCRGFRLSPVIGFRYVPLQCPAIVCQHTWGPNALVPLFHRQKILVKSFTVLVTAFGRIFWGKKKWNRSGSPKVNFQAHMASHSFIRSQYVLYNILIVRWFLISYEILANPLKTQPWISFSFIQVFIKLFVLHQFLFWSPRDIPSLIFESFAFGKLFLKYSNAWPVLSVPFTKFSWGLLYIQRGQKKLIRKNKRRTDDIFLPWRQWCSFKPQFICIVILLVPAVPLTQETAVFCVPELHSE